MRIIDHRTDDQTLVDLDVLPEGSIYDDPRRLTYEISTCSSYSFPGLSVDICGKDVSVRINPYAD